MEQGCRARHVSTVCRCSGTVCRFRYRNIAEVNQLDHIPNTEKKGRGQRRCRVFCTSPDIRMYMQTLPEDTQVFYDDNTYTTHFKPPQAIP